MIATGTLIDEAIGTVRNIATDLRPALLDQIGLEAAVEWQAREFQDRTGIDCSLRATVGDVALDPLVSIAVFRIFQESLTNVVRHSGAASVFVSLTFVDSDLVLEVHDDGIGISSDKMSSRRSIGLAGMRERAQLVGGAVSISSAAGDSTVLVKIPIRSIEPL
jgi:signal transduction histidine kinase